MNKQSFTIGLLTGLLIVALPAKAINAYLEDDSIHCLFFACAVSGVEAANARYGWSTDSIVEVADDISTKMMEKRRHWKK